jgi:uncharacterized protein DUF5916
MSLSVTVALIASPPNTFAQDFSPSAQMTMLPVAPKIDGDVDPAEWSSATIVDKPFLQIEPEYGRASPMRTIVRIGQTEAAIYIAFELQDSDSTRLAAALTQRDSNLERDDSVAVLLDTFSDERTAYLFRTNALGTQLDGRIADNGRTFDKRWDAAWRSAAVRHEDGWSAEFEIPLDILKYESGESVDWRANFLRSIPRRLETSMWSGPSDAVYRVSAFGNLQSIRTSKPQDVWQVIPYLLGSLEKGETADLQAGVDVRWRPSSRFGVDVTANPDFALVEADVETINLSRFELFVPEKRPFFLEGNEMYRQRIRQLKIFDQASTTIVTGARRTYSAATNWMPGPQ